MTRIVEVVTINAVQLDARIEAAVARAFEKGHQKHQDGGAIVSCSDAARRAKRRKGEVLAALVAGKLKGKREGSRWRIRVADLDAWAAK